MTVVFQYYLKLNIFLYYHRLKEICHIKMKLEQQLHLAIQDNDRQKVEELIDGGVDINCLFYAWTPLQHAITLGK